MTPKRLLQTAIFIITLFATLTIAIFPAYAVAPALPEFNSFVKTSTIGLPGMVSGVYVDGLFALNVVQQPKNNAGYVSKTPEKLTEFRNARQQKNVGLLAHNYLAGQYFTQLKVGQIVNVIYGDGKVEKFVITNIYKYQAVSPESPYSDFVNLDDGQRTQVEPLFKKMYGGSHHLTLQTCIAKDKELSWGRLFITADPVKDPELTRETSSDN
jgi:hypothetical protein